MDTEHPDTPQVAPAPHAYAAPEEKLAELEQLSDRIGARYIANLRTLIEALHQFYAAQLAEKDAQIAVLHQRVMATERERDALATQLHELTQTSARSLANLRATSEELSRQLERPNQQAVRAELSRRLHAPGSESTDQGADALVHQAPLPVQPAPATRPAAHLEVSIVLPAHGRTLSAPPGTGVQPRRNGWWDYVWQQGQPGSYRYIVVLWIVCLIIGIGIGVVLAVALR